MDNQKIRIRLRGYDHRLVDRSAAEIVEGAKRTGARIAGPVPMPLDPLALKWCCHSVAAFKLAR